MVETAFYIDIFCHIVPKKYKEKLYLKNIRSDIDAMMSLRPVPALYDIDKRLSVLDKYDGMLRQVLTINAPPLEIVVSSKDAIELAMIANDEVAELVEKFPDHFIAGVGCLPMNNIDAALREAERATCELKMKGVQLYTPCNEKPLDSPEFLPLYEMMTKFDLPIWLHPIRGQDFADYKGEYESKDHIFQAIGWPYETSLAMIRLVRSGILERYPMLKIITHHLGGMVPFFLNRLERVWKGTTEYFKKFYGDTAVSGSTAALMCGYACFGAEHILFGSDAPHGHPGPIITSVQNMAISDSEKRRIFEGNARKLLKI